MGYPRRAGDPTLVEWLQFDAYARQARVNDTVRAVVPLSHLEGCARDEVLRHPVVVQHDYNAFVAVLKFRFGPLETGHSLSAEFLARVQLDGGDSG